MSRKEKLGSETLAMRKRFTHRFYQRNRGMLTVTVFMMVLLSAFNLAISYLMQQIIDIATGSQVGPLITVSWWFGGIFLTFIFVYAIQRVTLPRFLRRAMRQYKDYAFEEITKKSISSFSGENTGKYISALTNDATSIETNYLSKIFSLIMMLVTFAGALAMMLWYSPLLTGIALVLSLLPAVASLLCGNKLAEAEKKVSESNEGFVGMIKDLLSGFAVIKSFKAEREVINLFMKQNRGTEGVKYRRRMTEELINMIGACSAILAQIGVFLFGAYLAITGDAVTPGVVIIFVQLMNFVLEPISKVPPILANRKAALALIDKLALAVSANVRREGKNVDNVLDDCIAVKNLTFGYEEGNPVLEDVSLTFKSGKSYAIVGGSGSGKSTLLNLLMGSCDDYTGSITYDGDELRSISSDSLYDLLSIVQQNVFVFNSSILSNITMFREFDGDKVRRAVEMSGLAPLIAERGGDYECGENGSGLSGGERQRLSIARCLLRETPILLVDEATAALDTQTAFAVTSSILDISGLTRIIVTHRLEETLLRKYDEIIVLRGGSVCEQGTFDELMAKTGFFYALYTVTMAD